MSSAVALAFTALIPTSQAVERNNNSLSKLDQRRFELEKIKKAYSSQINNIQDLITKIRRDQFVVKNISSSLLQTEDSSFDDPVSFEQKVNTLLNIERKYHIQVRSKGGDMDANRLLKRADAASAVIEDKIMQLEDRINEVQQKMRENEYKLMMHEKNIEQRTATKTTPSPDKAPPRTRPLIDYFEKKTQPNPEIAPNSPNRPEVGRGKISELRKRFEVPE